MEEKPAIFVCGASARQVVSMAASARMVCYAADLFCDFDTGKLARESVKIRRLENLSQVACRFEYDHCVLTGGMENYPDVVATICRKLPCRDRDSLVKCRDPFVLQEIIHESSELSDLDVEFPLTTRERPTSAQDGEWLIKQTDRSGGLGVRSLTAAKGVEKANQVYQRRVQGKLVSGLYIADGQNSAVLGVSQQWAGRSELGCADFVYCGSIAPYILSQSQFDAVSATGNVFTSKFGLSGVFGIDFILDTDRLRLLEINPRITASAEVCQKLLRLNIVEEHVRAIGSTKFHIGCLQTYANPPSPDQFFGKAIVFNRQSQAIVISTAIHRQLRDWMELGVSPSKIASGLGDVPMPHSVVRPGSPLLTVMVSAQKKSAVETRLLQLADEVYQMVDSSNSTNSRTAEILTTGEFSPQVERSG